MSRTPATLPRRRARLPSPTRCSSRAGVRDDIARDVADDPGRRRPPRPHDARPRAARPPISREIEKGAMAQGRRADGGQRAARGADVGRAAGCPGPGSRCARSTRRIAMARTLRHRHRRRPALASHRVPRRVSEARDRPRPDGAALLLGPVDAERRAVRRRDAGVHAQSARRGHPDVGRSDPARRFGELHDQRADRPPAPGAARSCRIRGCRTRRAIRRAIPPCCSASRRARCCRSAGSRRVTRATRSRCWSRR